MPPYLYSAKRREGTRYTRKEKKLIHTIANFDAVIERTVCQSKENATHTQKKNIHTFAMLTPWPCATMTHFREFSGLCAMRGLG